MNPYDQEDEQNVEAYWASLKDQDVIARDSQGRPALQDEARWTWHKVETELRAAVRGDFARWESEQARWWNNGCKS